MKDSNIKSAWQVINNKDVINILIGDIQYENLYGNKLKYLSGPDICSIAKKFGAIIEYNKKPMSRWQYMEELIDFCISNNKISKLLVYLCTISSDLEETDIVIYEVLEQINKIISYSDFMLLNLDSKKITIESNVNEVEIDTEVSEKISINYIINCYAKIKERFFSEEYDDVITLARTLVEEVLCFIIEENNETPSEKGDLKKLYNQVKDLYKMNAKEYADNRIKEMLSGFEKILTSIALFRNIGSSSHGVGSNRVNLNKHTAKLYMNSSLTFCEYIYSVYESKKDNI